MSLIPAPICSAWPGPAQPGLAWIGSGHPRLGSAGLSWPSSARLVSALLRHWPAQARFLVVKTNKNTDFCKNYGGGKFKLRRRKIWVWAWLGSTWARFGSARPALACGQAQLGSVWLCLARQFEFSGKLRKSNINRTFTNRYSTFP